MSSLSSALARVVTGRLTAWLLIVVALLAQSLFESRILIEGGWLLLVLFAVQTKRPATETPEVLAATPLPLADASPRR